MSLTRSFLALSVCCSIMLLSSCDKKGEKADHISQSPFDLYNAAVRDMQTNKHEEAIENFDLIEQYYSHSPIAERSYVLKAYVYYKMRKYEDALNIIGEYQELYKGTRKESAYMEYLKGKCFYDRINDSERSQDFAQDALIAFNTVTKQYPNSKYAQEAAKAQNMILELLAAKEMNIGRFYLSNKNPIAALGRFQFVNLVYPRSKSRPEALYRIAECYASLKIEEKMKFYLQILGKEYPRDEWTLRSETMLLTKASAVTSSLIKD